jgi:uncharacterized protein YbaP (TraB family)
MKRMLDRGAVGALMAYSRHESLRALQDPRNFERYMDAFIVRRNATMFRNALPLAEAGGAFLAVGALHLPGRRGLAQMFSDAGFEVTPVAMRRTTQDD